ncbi:methyltransferase domain-containing protein [Aliihoeflea aestuarii]|jgi:SAM-dependent methyltransferase|uniref:methyltransferase domain-containing protein n=1 Tax=Aliihoeflea aestuarii TaxID=453840 RepID=UPI0020957503|nr:methyltransferase domain-containing protein [Aliihoeflea aestuarii]MCO6392549.1 methyltransferase domain-containing protein [Aliihoeflea aestuarii]
MDAIFDPRRVLNHKLRALAQTGRHGDFLMRAAAAELGERLSTVSRRFERGTVLHGVIETATEALEATGKVDRIERVEADKRLLGTEAGTISPVDHLDLDAESFDLAISLYALGEVDDIPGALVQIRRALKPDGLFLGCLAGAGTLGELRESLLAAEAEVTGGAASRIHPFVDIRDAGALLQRAGFALPVADMDETIVRYDTMFHLMRDLKAMGATNALLGARPLRRSVLGRAAEIYAERFADPDGRIRATFATIWLSGWAPHVSQQKPARRGSATASLADALKNPG